MNVNLAKVELPEVSQTIIPVDLTKQTMEERKSKLLAQMKKRKLDTVIIYADREHGANFEYFTGFIPRFEEALLVIHRDGKAFLLLGNENTKMVNYSRIKAELIHVPYFSLPNQPMENKETLESLLRKTNIRESSQVALIGWKHFTSKFEKNQYLFDVPFFIVDSLKKIIKDEECLINGSDILISADQGIRTVNNANEIAHYEYGATLAGMGMLQTLNQVAVGKTEISLANHLSMDGQPNTITTICASGERFTDAIIYPRNKKLELGDGFSASVGYKGGLSSRSAYVAKNKEDLPSSKQLFEESLAKPYYRAVVTWLESIQIGVEASEIFNRIENVLPKETYHWELNPGHFTSDEEWLSSPFYPKSTAKIKSGQMFQIDIIPKIEGLGGVGCEDGIAIADQKLRTEIAKEYPEVWERISRRRAYLKNTLQISISEDILPLNDIVAYYRPYLLDYEMAFRIEK